MQRSIQPVMNDARGRTYFSKSLLALIKDPNKTDELLRIVDTFKLGNVTISSGDTLLHVAAEFRNLTLVNHLIATGSNLNTKNNAGKTPLILAIQWRAQPCVEALLEAHANIFIADRTGKNAINWFLTVPWPRRSVYARGFLKHVESQCMGDHELMASKLIAARWPLYCVELLEELEVSRIMLERGCEVDEREPKYGRTALHVAAMSLGVEHVRLLLDHHANPNALDNMNRTPITMAYSLLRDGQFMKDRSDILRLLLQRGASLITRIDGSVINQVDRVLMYGSRKMVEILMQANLMVLFNNPEEYDYPLHILASNRSPHVIKALENYDLDIDYRNHLGQTPLLVAALHGNHCTVEFLLDRGANVNVITQYGYSPLYRCVDHYLSFEAQHKECIQILLEHGADVSVRVYIGAPTVFDIVRPIAACMAVAKMLIANVALQQALGVTMAQYILQKITTHKPYDDYYKNCKQKLQVALFKTVTLFDLLKASRVRFVLYAKRNFEMAASVEQFNNEYKTEYEYYNTILQKRYAETARILNLRMEAAYYLSMMIGTDYSRYPLIIDEILGYLEEQDLRTIISLYPV